MVRQNFDPECSIRSCMRERQVIMLQQYIVYTTAGAYCIEDDSEHGAVETALLMVDYPEFERVIAVKRVNVYQYPY